MKFQKSELLRSLLLPLLIFTGTSSATAEGFSFSAVSDIPYNREQEKLLEKEIIPALRATPSPFTLHLGDFKAGSSACSDSLFLKRQSQINRMHPHYVIYTPGDNDWTDCDREGDSEIERLEKIRSLFFLDPVQFPKSWNTARQENFPENFRWIYKDVAFSTVHIVGTNNGRKQIKVDDIDEALRHVEARDDANKIWIEALFRVAKQQKSKAVIIAMQADISDPSYEGDCTSKEPQICDGYSLVRKQLIQAAKQFKKPVLILHGDTAPYCIDKNFGGNNAPNLWRFNSGGDYHLLDAVKITVRPDNKEPFAMESLREHEAPDPAC